MSEPDRYYSDWDRWFAEEHDGTPVEWVVCEVACPVEDNGDGLTDIDHLSLCCTKGPGTRKDPEQPEHIVALPQEKHTVIHRFEASSYMEAAQKQYDAMGWGTYNPHPGWNVEKGVWEDGDPE